MNVTFDLAGIAVSAALPAQPDLADGLSRLLPRAAEGAEAVPGVRVEHRPDHGDFFLSGEGLPRAFACRDPLDAICGATAGLIGGFARRTTDALCFHAAALLHEGRAYLIPTVYNTGKSTFCVAWVAQGGQLVSDDAAVMKIASRKVSSFGIPLRIRTSMLDDAPQGIRDFAQARIFMRGPRLAYLRLPDDQLIPAGAEHPFGGWIFLSRHKGRAAELSRLNPGAALQKIIWQNFARNRPASELLDFMSTIAADFPCYQLSYEESVEAVPVLRRGLSGEEATLPVKAMTEPVRSIDVPHTMRVTETADGVYIADDSNGRVYVLNPSAAVMWNVARVAPDAAEALSILCELYPGQPPGDLERDYGALVESLRAARLL